MLGSHMTLRCRSHCVGLVRDAGFDEYSGVTNSYRGKMSSKWSVEFNLRSV